MLSDLFAPRGLELYVPALAALRCELWSKLGADLQLALEVADYLGLERLTTLSDDELAETAATVLPGPLWEALDRHLAAGRRLSGELGFVARIGNAIAVDQVN